MYTYICIHIYVREYLETLSVRYRKENSEKWIGLTRIEWTTSCTRLLVRCKCTKCSSFLTTNGLYVCLRSSY